MITYIEYYTSVKIVTQPHNCDVRKDSDRSNYTIFNLFFESCDLIGHYIFWRHSFYLEWLSIPKFNLRYYVPEMSNISYVPVFNYLTEKLEVIKNQTLGLYQNPDAVMLRLLLITILFSAVDIFKKILPFQNIQNQSCHMILFVIYGKILEICRYHEDGIECYHMIIMHMFSAGATRLIFCL